MCKEKSTGFWVGMGLVGVGVAIGAYAAKKYIDRRRKLMQNYNIEVDRLQNEVDFDYSEEFLKELKKDTLNADKKQLSKEDIKKVVKENTEALKLRVTKLEGALKDRLKKTEDSEDDHVAEDSDLLVVNVKDVVAKDEDFEPEDE